MAACIMVAVFLFLKFSRFGRGMRAVADNPDLARLKGIDPKTISFVALFLGCGLAGVGGVLIGLDTSIDPLTGYRVCCSRCSRRRFSAGSAPFPEPWRARWLWASRKNSRFSLHRPPTARRGLRGDPADAHVPPARPSWREGVLMLSYLIFALTIGGIYALARAQPEPRLGFGGHGQSRPCRLLWCGRLCLGDCHGRGRAGGFRLGVAALAGVAVGCS